MALSRRVTDLESDLSETRTALACRTQELAGIASNYTTKMNDVLSQHSEELNGERQKSQQAYYMLLSITLALICLFYIFTFIMINFS